jgi:Leucine-rich repeat (LRR) protein
MKKIINKFLILSICFFVASNLQLLKSVPDYIEEDATITQQEEKDPYKQCPICFASLYYQTDDAGNLINKNKEDIPANTESLRIGKEEDIIPVDDSKKLVNESDISKLIPLSDSRITTLSCNHKFHTDCIDPWVATQVTGGQPQTCPVCRAPTPQPEIPQPVHTQNEIIRVFGRSFVSCKILTQAGFAEVKTYLQEHPEVVELRLRLTDNTRQIPGDFFVGLNHLVRLDFIANQLTSLPPSIGGLRELRELYLDNNQLTSLPPEIGSLSSLQSLSLQNNQLTALPSEIENLTNLRELYLSHNHLVPWPTRLINQLQIQNRHLRIQVSD